MIVFIDWFRGKPIEYRQELEVTSNDYKRTSKRRKNS